MSPTELRPPPPRPPVTEEMLHDITARLVVALNPEKVILFGSRAYGTPRPDSDIDLFVIAESEETQHRRMMRARDAAAMDAIPMDIFVYTPTELERRLEMGDFFIRHILAKGRVLYACDAS